MAGAPGRESWAAAHTLSSAQPGVVSPDGAVVATTATALCQSHPLRTPALNSSAKDRA
ncbi:hypothetical protein ACIBL8_38610 [Streptomyces sp. NPDC050523]|uniref:hypothetical protein n=1 Tax=Streptomyces sp. NPDC050523 TaxID=3365622 RepID=UPI00378C1965